MTEIKYKSIVTMNYSLSGNGNVFESTFESQPVEITIGKSNLPQIIESSLYGLKAGQVKEYSYSSMEIFGKYDDDKVKTTPLTTFKNYKNPKPGDIIETVENNKSYFMTVLNILGDKIVVDLNHPLSGKDIMFKVEILKVSNET